MGVVFPAASSHRRMRLAGCVVVGLLCAPSVFATIMLSASGTSAKGVDVTFEARLTLSGDILTIQLNNVSPEATRNPDDVMGSFYFDIANAQNVRPTLSYTAALGDVYRGNKNGPDLLHEADADLLADEPRDNTWAFGVMDPSWNPHLGFGIGTVGNSALAPNNFMGNIVDGVDFGIYRDEITTRNLHGRLMVKDTATFSFTGVSGYTEADVSTYFAFGLGTAPDSLLTPEPGAAALFCIGLLGLRVAHRGRKVVQTSDT